MISSSPFEPPPPLCDFVFLDDIVLFDDAEEYPLQSGATDGVMLDAHRILLLLQQLDQAGHPILPDHRSVSRPSCSSRTLNFSVDNIMSSMGPRSLLVSDRGKRSFAASNASIQAFLSSSVSHLKCNVFVPLNIYSLLSSDLLARIDET